MVKSELVQKLCNMHPNILRKDIEKILDIIIIEMIEALCRNEAVEIRGFGRFKTCLLYTSPSPRDRTRSRMPSSA